MLVEGEVNVEKLKSGEGVIICNEVVTYNDNTGQRKKIEILDIEIGDTIEIRREIDENKTIEIKQEVIGIVSDMPFVSEDHMSSKSIISSKEFVEEVFEDASGMINFNVEDVEYVEGIKEKLDSKNINYRDAFVEAQANREASLIMSIFVYGFIVIITLIGAVNIINTISANIILRTREFAMLKAVGMTKFSMIKMIIYEGLTYAIIATFWGGIIGSGLNFMIHVIIRDVFKLKWMIPLDKLAEVAIIATIIVLISSLVVLRKINKGVIVENIRLEE